MVQWWRDTSVGCSDVNQQSITVNESVSSFRITGLEPGNRYTITVRGFNTTGSGLVSNTLTGMTLETGKGEPNFTLPCSLLFSTAPSSGPTSVIHGTITASSITVQWGEVACLHRNGDITSYTVQAVRNGMVERTASVPAGAARETTISGLSPSAHYTVQVAAVNGAGTGPYSAGIPIMTNSKCRYSSTLV